MKTTFLLGACVALLTATGAFAAGTHDGGHEQDEAMAIGVPGEASKVKRTMIIVMSEKDDGSMGFQPAALDVKAGETIRLRFQNKGEVEHEFVMDTNASIMEHKELMAKFPEMEHADANAIRLEPGKRGEIVWTFANAGKFEFACLIPGHYESGMKGELTVAN